MKALLSTVLFGVALLAGMPAARAQMRTVGSGAGVLVKDEGASQGAISTLDCVGPGVACAVAGSAGTITVTAGGAGSSFSGVSVGPSPVYSPMAPNVATLLPLDGAEEWDTDSYHAGFDDFVTIPAAGKYEINLIFSYYGIHPYSWDLYLIKNDPGNDCVASELTVIVHAQGPMPPLSYLTLHATPIYFGIFSLAAGDTLILCARHNYTAASDFAVWLFQATRR